MFGTGLVSTALLRTIDLQFLGLHQASTRMAGRSSLEVMVRSLVRSRSGVFDSRACVMTDPAFLQIDARVQDFLTPKDCCAEQTTFMT